MHTEDSHAEPSNIGPPASQLRHAWPKPKVKVREWHDRLRDPCLTALLLTQLLAIFVVAPVAALDYPVPRFASLVLVLAVVGLVVIVSRGRRTILIGLVCLLVSIGGVVLRERHETVVTYAVAAAGVVIALAVLCWVVGAAVFGPGRVTYHRVRGAIVLYLNIGLIFTALYRFVDEVSPGSFVGLPPAWSGAKFESALLYFSFTTLTSVGFGDIVPIHPLARSLANFEAIFGQLYPATLLARIVMLHMESHRR
jgi:ion channel